MALRGSALRGVARRGASQARLFFSTKPGFWVGNFTPKEGADMEDFATNYRQPMIASLEPFGGKLRMVAPKPDTVYHHGDAGAVNWIAEFPSVEQAQQWHDSPAYQDVIPCREKHITCSFVIAEGTGA